MIDFFHEGSNVGFSINGVSGFLFLIYIIIEIVFYLITKTFLVHKLFIGLRVRYQVIKVLPKWWCIKKISYLTINRNKIQNRIHDDYGRYEVYIELKSKLSTDDNTIQTNDCLKVNWLGEIFREDLTSNIEFYDNRYQKEIKQWLRNNALEEIGI
jgi:hypothetical protein